MVRLARKYLISLVDSCFRSPSLTLPTRGRESPSSKIKSKRKGLSGWTLMPFRIGGLNSGLRGTITPGAGKVKSWAWAEGRGPNVLAKKAKISPRAILALKFKHLFIYGKYALFFPVLPFF